MRNQWVRNQRRRQVKAVLICQASIYSVIRANKRREQRRNQTINKVITWNKENLPNCHNENCRGTSPSQLAFSDYGPSRADCTCPACCRRALASTVFCTRSETMKEIRKDLMMVIQSQTVTILNCCCFLYKTLTTSYQTKLALTIIVSQSIIMN